MTTRQQSAPREGKYGPRMAAMQEFNDNIHSRQASAGNEHGGVARDLLLALALPGIIEYETLRPLLKIGAERRGRLVAGGKHDDVGQCACSLRRNDFPTLAVRNNALSCGAQPGQLDV